jgi:MFS family permease
MASVTLGTIGGVGMWSVIIILPEVQKEFGISRADASLSYSLAMTGYGLGGVLMGRMVDSLGLFRPLVSCIIVMCLGYIATAYAENAWQFAIAYSLFIAMLGSAISFGPLIADVSLWFERRRGIAVAIVSSANYLAGTISPPVIQYLVANHGWRQTHVWIGIFCFVTMLPLAFIIRRPAPIARASPVGMPSLERRQPVPPFSLPTLQALLLVAGLTCCLAMSMPQVHIVAYCGDLGFDAARGAEMLSLMFGFGIISRLASGMIADRIGGVKTLLLGSALQGVALMLYLPFDSLTSLYVASALFGLFQGGLVPSYAIIVRTYFPPQEAATRVSMVMTATLLGMAVGGWLTGLIFDLTGSYKVAFLNGIFWNGVNLVIVMALLWRAQRPSRAPAMMAAQPAE